MSIQEQKHSGRLPLAVKSRKMGRRKSSLKENRKMPGTVSLALTVLLPLGHPTQEHRPPPRPGLPGHSTRSSTAGQLYNTLLSGLPKLALSSSEGWAWLPLLLSAPGRGLAHNNPLRKAEEERREGGGEGKRRAGLDGSTQHC